MAKPSYDECLVEAELRARAAYSEPHRCYHDERHLKECLAEFDWILVLNERDRRILKWAILWHDAVYEPGRSDNEERSAELALRELEACGVATDGAAEVARLIRLTERHRVDPANRLGALMVSIDLAILGADEDRYRQYAADVRREHAHLDDEAWRTGRALVLQHLLEADPLYPDRDFRDRLELQARRNIAAELSALRAG